MEIREIKQKLKIETVLARYDLTPDHNHRLRCPFHDDKTPSFQVYPETGTWTCFSSSCSAGSGDQIDFIMKYEKITKHEAILKAKDLLGPDKAQPSSAAESLLSPGNIKPPLVINKPELTGASNDSESLSRIAVLTKIFGSFLNGMSRSQPGRQYAANRGLDPERLDIGFNSGQYHHNGKVNDNLMQSFVKYGLLKPIGKGTHQVFGKNCICFALKNPAGHVTGLYFRSIFETNGNTDQARHFYLKDRQGLFPSYPKPDTIKLILTEAIIDAATLLQMEEITKEYGILALYGTNGLTDEHKKAIGDLKELQEIILFMDGDQAGREATKKHSETLHSLNPGIKISYVETPDSHDINSLYTSHEREIFTHLLASRNPSRPSSEDVPFSFSIEKTSTEKKNEPVPAAPVEGATSPGKLDTTNPYNLLYQGEIARYSIRGGVRSDMESLRVSIVIENLKQAGPFMKYRNKVDLYENRQVEKIAKEAADKLDVRADLIELDMHHLTDLLEDYRDTLYGPGKEGGPQPVIKADPAMISRCREFLSSPDLIERLNRAIGESGVVGEETNRMFLFIIATSYRMPDTLHALIQGSTGSGKTHLLDRISRLMPPEDVKRFTRVTDSSFYNYGAYDLQNKLICLEDLDGMKEEAQLAFRELQSREMLSTSTTGQDEKGNLRSYEKVVYGPIASLSCTTRGDIYEDNMSRCFVIAVDETAEQTARVISYQNRRATGAIDPGREQDTALFLQNCIRLLKPYPVINPYADKVHLPQEAHKIRRLNELYQSFVRQVALVNQYRRDKDSRGRLIARKEDLLTAADIMFESILLKIDELDGGLRQFYERLKDYVRAMGGDHPGTYAFGQREVRMALNVSKSQLQRYIYDLRGLEYIFLSDGHPNRGYRYRIIYWDDIRGIRARLKRHLEGQLAQLELITTTN